MQPLLTIEHLSKEFPGQTALDDVHLTIGTGQTHALVGQNGSGKSTLIKILAGYHQPTGSPRATMHLPSGDRELRLGDTDDAERAGIRFVHQDLGLVDTLSSVENLALGGGFGMRHGRIDWRGDRRRAAAELAELGFDDFSVTAPVGTLAPSQKTAVAVARALRGWQDGASLLVLDEPTASLPGADVERLFTAIRRLKSRGVSILYVSHHLDEVFQIADEVTVLRDGRNITTAPVAELDHDRLIELMIGHRIAARAERRRRGASLPPRSCRRGGRQRAQHRPAGARRRSGGRGRHHRVGSRARRTAHHRADPHARRHRRGQRHRHAAVPAARVAGRRHGVPRRRSRTPGHRRDAVGHRQHHTRQPRPPPARPAHRPSTRTRRGAELDRAAGHQDSRGPGRRSRPSAAATSRRCSSPAACGSTPLSSCSTNPPAASTSGPKEEIHLLIDRAAAGGAAVVVASTDTDELVRLAHRVLIMRAGRIGAELVGDQISAENIERSQLATQASAALPQDQMS